MSGLGFDPADAPVLQRGSQDQDWVAYVQQMLASLGYPCGVADGDFGPLTESTVAEFQRGRGLSDTGVVDHDTWTALGSAVQRDGDGNDDVSGYGIDTSGGWQGSEHGQAQAPTHNDGQMSYLLPEDERRLVDAFGVFTSLERSGNYIVAVTRVRNLGNDTITDVELTVTLASEYGRQESSSSQARSLPPSEAIEAYTQMEIDPGERTYTMVMNGVGTGVLPVTHADTCTIDPLA